MEVTELLRDAVSGVKNMLDVESVIGEPIYSNDSVTVIPITKMSIGFACAGGEIEGKFPKINKELPAGGIGGGANIKPLGFLVVCEDKVKFLSVEEGDNKWEKYVSGVLDFLSK
ncbi:MAG: GerW family sporulation protein [Christensenellales bacterium]